MNLAKLSRADTLQFIRQEAGLRGIAALLEAPDKQLSAIYETVGGNPLALKLVIGQITVSELKPVLHNLQQALGKRVEDTCTHTSIGKRGTLSMRPANRFC